MKSQITVCIAKSWQRLLLLGIAALATMSSLSASVIYQETFTNASGSVQPVTYISGWNAYVNASATPTAIAANISNTVGNPNSSIGYLGFSTAGYNYGVVGTFSSIDIANSTITWNMGNSNTLNTARLLVQIAGSWYASNTTFSNNTTYTAATFASAETSAVEQSLTFSTTAANWRNFTLNPSVSMAVGSVLSLDLTSSNITGIGFYMSTAAVAGAVSRIDTLTVTVPEPSISVLVVSAFLGMVLFLQFVRKKTRS